MTRELSAPTLIREHRSLVSKLQATQEERVCRGEVLGSMVVTEPFYTDRRHDRAILKIDGENAGTEWTSIPWSFLKPIVTTYWLNIDFLDPADAWKMLHAAGVTDCELGWIEEDPYADPTRWGLRVRELEDAVRVWKLYKTTTPSPLG